MNMESRKLTVAAIGCSGHIAETFVRGFLAEGVALRILARNPNEVARRYPGASIVAGSMMNPADVAKAMDGADGAFLMTPMAVRDNPTNEIDAANAVIAGAKAAGLSHLVYTSAIGAERITGVGILDAKFQVERLLTSSGLPCSILRCGSYMEDIFDPRLELLRKGKFLFPVTKSRRFTYTSQKDVPTFVVRELLQPGRVLNRAIAFASPRTYTIHEVEDQLTQASGHPIKAPAKFPTYYLYMAALPYFRWRGHRFASILPLIRHFDQHGCLASGETVATFAPSFHMTSLDEHLRGLFRS